MAQDTRDSILLWAGRIARRCSCDALPLSAVGFSLLLLVSDAGATCLSGVGSTGYQSGSWTSSVLLPNSAPVSEIEGEACEPNSGSIGPLLSAAGAGTSNYLADYGGTNVAVSISAGGTQVGSGGSSSGGTARWTVRIDSEPGYAGPTTIDIDLHAQVVINGATQLSGPSSASGSYQSEFSILPAAGGLATILLTSNAALLPVSPNYPIATTSVNIDTDYVIQVFQFAQVTAAGNPPPMEGSIGTASSWGSIKQSFGIGVSQAYSDPLLSVKFPIEDQPGGYAPYPGSAPVFPVAVPGVGTLGGVLLAASICGVQLAARRHKMARTQSRR